MTFRSAAIFLSIFAVGLIAAPGKTLARGGFSGGHPVAFHGGIARPIGRPAIAHTQGRFAQFSNHRRLVGRGASAAVLWGVSPWYDGYASAEVAPDEQQPTNLETQPANPVTVGPPVRPPSSWCTERSYKVPSEAGGQKLVKVVHC
jgi:hypothetical protein